MQVNPSLPLTFQTRWLLQTVCVANYRTCTNHSLSSSSSSSLIKLFHHQAKTPTKSLMEKLHLQCLPLHLVLLQFLSLLLLSSSVYVPPVKYVPKVKYFMNCGSGSNFTLGDDRIFLGDKNSDPSSFSVGDSKPITDDNPSRATPGIYQTARIYNKTSPYQFNIPENGTYLVRLHFFPFISKGTNLSRASFNISTSNSWLLSDFSVGNLTVSPVIKEFYLAVHKGSFLIFFIPSSTAAFAFVNAIEVFLLPENYITAAFPVPPLQGTINHTLYVQNETLMTRHRIIVGGSEVNDSFWRNWIPDDGYLVSGSPAKCDLFTGSFQMGDNLVEEVAPDQVYRSCKAVNLDNKQASNFSNATWGFDTRKKAKHLVRLHFCDIISNTSGTLSFLLYIDTNYKKTIDPYEKGNTQLASPFFDDFVIDSDDSGHMNISISPDESASNKIAFLNGLEIMEFMPDTTMEKYTPPNGNKHLTLKFVLAGGLALVSILISILSLLWCLRKRRTKKPVEASLQNTEFCYPKGGCRTWNAERTDTHSPVPNLNLKLIMSFTDILAATHNFDTKFLIGEGGFGKVYRGTLMDGTKVAVKRSDPSHGQGFPEFQTEVMILSKIRHRHLVSLIGYCDERNEMILVYEFMEKGTLRDHLYSRKTDSTSPSTTSKLTWKQRLEICIGSAKGLHYLHTGTNEEILHRDVKSTNILLDEHFVAKVADFGLSQTVPLDPDHIPDVSVGFKGTFGYHDPEYFNTFQLTHKSDVYSFGVVLLEVLCARPPILENSQQREERNLADWGLLHLKIGRLEEIIDPVLADHINPNSLRKFAEIAERCLKREGADRPSMVDVLWELIYALQLQQSRVPREPHEDSTTDVSSKFPLPLVHHLGSDNFVNEEDGMPSGGDYDSDTGGAGVVFSQLSIDGTR